MWKIQFGGGNGQISGYLGDSSSRKNSDPWDKKWEYKKLIKAVLVEHKN